MRKVFAFSSGFRKKIASFLLLFIIIFAIGVGSLNLFYIFIFGNFHKIDDDAYRSAQLYTRNLPQHIKKYKIKSILNLRGKNTFRSPWYEHEKEIAEKLGVELIDFKIGSRDYIPYEKSLKLVQILKKAPKPILIHCRSGADRTSFVAALYEFAVKCRSEERAKEQFSFVYGHLPYFGSKTIEMDRSFEDFIKRWKDENRTCKNPS